MFFEMFFPFENINTTNGEPCCSQETEEYPNKKKNNPQKYNTKKNNPPKKPKNRVKLAFVGFWTSMDSPTPPKKKQADLKTPPPPAAHDAPAPHRSAGLQPPPCRGGPRPRGNPHRARGLPCLGGADGFFFLRGFV